MLTVPSPLPHTTYRLLMRMGMMEETKQEEVPPLPLPKTKGELKAFIGLVYYFRDHMKDLSIVLRPLDKLVTLYHPKDILI